MASFSASAMFALLLLCCFCATVQANSLRLLVVDQQQRPLADAVIELTPQQAIPYTEPPQASVAQQGLLFTPFVSAVRRGSRVDFPNQDKTRHHVYSFSAAKTFEIELYSGKPEQPVLFDKAGIVALGCNIHDYMQAYIYIGESPFLAVTNAEGKVHFNQLPAGQFSVNIWHPWQLHPFTLQPLELQHDTELQYQLPVADNTKPRAPKRGFGG